jgi:hypothetical protein
MPGRSGLNAPARPDVVNQSWLDNKRPGNSPRPFFFLWFQAALDAEPSFAKLRFAFAGSASDLRGISIAVGPPRENPAAMRFETIPTIPTGLLVRGSIHVRANANGCFRW